MAFEEQLKARSGNACELCGSANDLSVYTVLPVLNSRPEGAAFLCNKCIAQIDKKEDLDPSHWSGLRNSMWSDVPAVQVLAWRMLNRLKHETWAVELLDQLYLDDENLAWAQATGEHLESHTDEVHRDSLGNQLRTGDSVTLIKSLDVKGSQINARIGTVVKNIKIVADNTEQIEGKVEGQQIVILTKFVRKSS